MDRVVCDVEVLIPTFQRAELLRRAINSVQAQTYSGLRICVYDNASTDETEAIVAQLALEDPRITYFRHDVNIGVTANFNFALSRVTSPYFAFLSDDDVLLPDCILDAVGSLSIHSDVVCWGGNTLQVNSLTGRLKRGAGWLFWPREVIYSPFKACARICSGNHMEFQGLVFRTSMVRESGVHFNSDVGLADVDFELALASRYSAGTSTKISAVLSVHEGSISSGVRPFTLYWPAMEIIGRRLISSTALTDKQKLRCIKKWDKTVIFLLVNYAPLWVKNEKSFKYSNIVQILKVNYPTYFLSFVCQIIINLYSGPPFVRSLAWLTFKLIHFALRPLAYINHLLPMTRRSL